MSLRTSSCAGAVVMALAVMSITTPAFADAKKDAQVLFEMAVKQADAGDNAAALSSFRAAYEKFPNYKVLYNIGKVCSRMGDAPCAVRNYEQYLRDGDKEVPRARRKEVEGEIKSLSRTLAMVTVKSNLTGGDVTVDDQVVGKVPLSGPVPVRGGEHKITVSHDGKKAERTVTVVAGESASIVLDADKDAPAAAAPAPAPKATAKDDPKKDKDAADKDDGPIEPTHTIPKRDDEPGSFPVVPWAVTGALAGATILTGVLTASAYGSYQDKKEEFPVSRDDLDSSQGTARDLFVLTSVLGACTVISAGVATYFTFFSSPSPGAGPPPSKARIGLAVGPRGFALQGVLP
jgi:hypothetical protein